MSRRLMRLRYWAKLTTKLSLTVVRNSSGLLLNYCKVIDSMITGPTFEEMLHPHKLAPETRSRAIAARTEAPLDPVNLFNITWRDPHGKAYHVVLPRELTGIDADIVVLYGKEFPPGSHKVGSAYPVLLDKELFGEVEPTKHTIVWTSTGSY